MRIIKGFFLTIVIFFFILVLMFAQLSFAFNSTFLSSKFFNSSFDNNNISTSIKDIFISKLMSTRLDVADLRDEPLSDFEESILQSVDLGPTVLKYLDIKWFEEQISVISKGTLSYVFNDAKELPSINIKPAKSSLLNGITTEIMKRDSTKRDIENISKIIQILDNKYVSMLIDNDETDEVVNQLLKLDIVKESNLDKDMVLAIIKVYRENRSDDINTISESLVYETFNSKLNIENYKDYLDLNLLFSKVFKDSSNPLTDIKILIASLKSILVRTLLLLLTLLIVVVFITTFDVSGSLKWIANGFIVGGLSSLLVGLIKFLPMVSKVIYYNSFYSIKSLQSIDSISNFQGWIEAFINRFSNVLMIQGGFLVLLAIAIHIIVNIISKHSYEDTFYEDYDGSSSEVVAETITVNPTKRKSSILIVSLRLVVVLTLVILVPVTTMLGVRDFKSSFEEFRISMDNETDNLENLDMLQIMKEVLEKE